MARWELLQAQAGLRPTKADKATGHWARGLRGGEVVPSPTAQESDAAHSYTARPPDPVPADQPPRPSNSLHQINFMRDFFMVMSWNRLHTKMPHKSPRRKLKDVNLSPTSPAPCSQNYLRLRTSRQLIIGCRGTGTDLHPLSIRNRHWAILQGWGLGEPTC